MRAVAIYRIISESIAGQGDEDGPMTVVPGPLRGPMSTGVMAHTMDGLPMPALTDERVRFWFTEAGWARFGIPVTKEHEAAGLVVRVLRRKNPNASDVVYRDKWQVAVLPSTRRRSGGVAGELGAVEP